jgi:hypothetical protein
MANHTGSVAGGVDAHTDEHHVAVVDLQGRLLGATVFPTTAAGYALLIGWLRSHGEVERVGVESTGAYAAGLVRALRVDGISVVEVNQPHRHARQRLGKSDPATDKPTEHCPLGHPIARRARGAAREPDRRIVSTVRKSQAIMLAACDRRNSRQLGPPRRGAGSSPA